MQPEPLPIDPQESTRICEQTYNDFSTFHRSDVFQMKTAFARQYLQRWAA
jgi:hypothetical protein